MFGLAITPKGRGIVFLVALGITALATGLMWDNIITPLYGLAFAPLYICLVIGFIDTVVAGTRGGILVEDVYVPPDRKQVRASRARACIGIFNLFVWIVLLVLLPLLLSGVKTVFATAISAVFILWLAVMLIAHARAPDNEDMRAITLMGIAEYLSEPPLVAVNALDMNAYSSNYEMPEPPADLEEGAFDQQLGTVREISVRESLRGSPPTTLRESPLRADDEVPMDFDEEGAGLCANDHYASRPSGSHPVIVPLRLDSDNESFDPDAPGMLETDVRG